MEPCDAGMVWKNIMFAQFDWSWNGRKTKARLGSSMANPLQAENPETAKSDPALQRPFILHMPV